MISAPSPALQQTPPAATLDSIHLSHEQAQALVRLIESAADVQRRFQYFVWLQTQVDVLLPHALAICGAYLRPTRQLHYEVFNSLTFGRPVLDALAAADSALMARAAQLWVQGQGRPLLLTLPLPPDGDCEGGPWQGVALAGELARLGLRHVLVHAVARPARLHEIETLFLLADTAPRPAPGAPHLLELVLPHLHSTLLRMQSLERELGGEPLQPPASAPERQVQPVTAREVQILQWVREGKSNQAIGELLGISALTVKNHIQKVMRKLGASNRAHAVTLAARLHVLPAGVGESVAAASGGSTPR